MILARASTFNHLTAKLSNLYFHPLEAVPRCRDPQLQVGENCSYLFIMFIVDLLIFARF